VGLRVEADGSKVRYLKKTGEVLPERSFRLAKASSEDSSSGGSSGEQPPAAGGDAPSSA
jgi:hypothetical protein